MGLGVGHCRYKWLGVQILKQGDYSRWPSEVCGLAGDAQNEGRVTESLFCPVAPFSIPTLKAPPRPHLWVWADFPPTNWSAGRQRLLWGEAAAVFLKLLGRMGGTHKRPPADKFYFDGDQE